MNARRLGIAVLHSEEIATMFAKHRRTKSKEDDGMYLEMDLSSARRMTMMYVDYGMVGASGDV